MSQAPKKPTHPAGGWPALGSSLKHIAKQTKQLRSIKGLLKVNQPNGFDCPGCAWPEPPEGHTSSFEFCENGAKAVAWESTGKTVGAAFFGQHTVTHLAEQSDHWLESQGRLAEPLAYDTASDTYKPIAWQDAFDEIGAFLAALPDADQAEFYTSGRTSNEAAFMYQLLARRLGTNNLPDCSNMCHESSGVALNEQIGVGKGTVRLPDFDEAEAIFVIGQNPGTNHPRMLSQLQKSAKRGCPIVSINPLRERGLESFLHPQDAAAMLTNKGTPLTNLYIQPQLGGDLALLTGVIKYVLLAEEENPGKVLDHAFIKEHTTGFESFRASVLDASWKTIETQSGVNRNLIAEIANVYMQSSKSIVCWAMGLTQHKHAVPTIQMAVNLLMLKGNLGKPGAGACPVRGHSNVQGDRTMGITERPSAAFNAKLKEVFNFEPPTGHGHSVVESMQAMLDGKSRFFMSMGGNFASATPDTPRTIEALKKCDLTVHVATKLNRTHTATGKRTIILPCLGRTEKDITQAGLQRVTVEDSMSMVHASTGHNAPVSPQLKSEPAIVAGIAQAAFGSTFPQAEWASWATDHDTLRNTIEKVIPGFDNFNERLKTPGGFDLGSPVKERVWNTAEKKAPFITAEIPDLSLPGGQLKLMTLRSHDQYNTTVYGMNDRYRNITGKRNILFMNSDDTVGNGLRRGELVCIQSHFDDGQERKVEDFEVIAYDIPQGCCAGYFPELNALISMKSVADRSLTPTSKFIPITVKAMKPFEHPLQTQASENDSP